MRSLILNRIFYASLLLSLLIVHSSVYAQQVSSLALPQKTVDVRNSVYKLLDYYQSSGLLGYLPQARPYSNQMIFNYLEKLAISEELTRDEKRIIEQYKNDFLRSVNGFIAKQQHKNNGFAVLGASASIEGKYATGNNGTYTTSNIFEPFFAGRIGNNITVFGAMGLAVERLAPDIFNESYTADKAVHFPYEGQGYAYHPYQFNYETMYNHVNIDASSAEGNALHKDFTAGMIYHAEISGSWFNNSIRFSFHNNRRSWGYNHSNLILSSSARRMPGIDFVVEPVKWLRYSMLVSSTFHYPSQIENYKKNIYGYDLGNVQNILTLQMLELEPWPWFQLAITGGNLWTKRMELAYIMPFTFPHLTQIDIGDHDNLFMGTNMSFRIPKAGKFWFSIWIDELSFLDRSSSLLKLPHNRFAWQAGWDLPLPLPLTIAHINYTRLTPFIYTHYPETDFNTMSSRPMDMTYTHDGANIGFYLPPNSSELKISISNLSIPNLTLELDNRYIIHGTNDLNGETNKIFGDVYRHQIGGRSSYPLVDFTNDGIYDYTFYSQLTANYRVRKIKGLGYYRLVGEAGYSHTRWESNNSGVTAPKAVSMLSFSIGLSVDF